MTPQGYAGNQYLLDINGDAGNWISVLAKSTVRRLIVEESTITAEGAANTLQGLLQYQIPNDGTTNGFTTIFQAVGANTEATEGQVIPARIELGSKIDQIAGAGETIGQLGQPIVGANPPGLTAATTMIKLRSGTGTGTTVMVTELN